MQIDMFKSYLAGNWIYFNGSRYIDEDTDRISALLPVFYNLYQNTCTAQKKQFLVYQSSLFDVGELEAENVLVSEAEVAK